MPKRILLIGNGGREHAIGDALARSPQTPDIYNFGSAVNPGIAALAEAIEVGDYMDLAAVQEYAKKIEPDFAVVGPDDPIGAGAVDALAEIGVPSFAPTKACAQLESSKSFTRHLLQKHNIDVSPGFAVFIDPSDETGRRAFFAQYDGQIVVKADGLLGGKGVIVAGDHFTEFGEAEAFALQSIERFGRVVLEEKLVGEEFSLISIVDGETVLDCPAIQDHKRAYEGDTGPNTGGMGCISDERHSLPFLTEADIQAAHEITVRTMQAVQSETGERYVGLMFGGFMVTKTGVKLIEYNCRFGDPEALNILPILQDDFVAVCEKAIAGQLSDIGKLTFQPVATVVKYLCPEGYPTNSVKNVPILDHRSRDGAVSAPVRAFFASVAQVGNELHLKGSRAIGCLGTGANLSEANQNCDQIITNFSGPLFYRKDIGTAELIQKRIDHMHQIRA